MISKEEWSRAIQSDPKEYPQDMPCAVCGNRWMQHLGKLCPTRPGYISEFGHPVPALFVDSDTTFIPDTAYYKRPDFDVV
jgi:hypothetical protein